MLDQMYAIHELVKNTDKLEKLESELNKFNPFDVLRVGEMEIRHSNVLAWLLNPLENHNIGDWFLKNFLKEILLSNDCNEMSATDIHLMDFNDVSVEREKYDIDILTVSEQNKLVLYIENKINAKENKNQLKKYSEIIEKKYSSIGYEIIPLFLTVDRTEPKEAHNKELYLLLSYQEVQTLIKRLLASNILLPNSHSTIFIKQYLDILAELTGSKESNAFVLAKEIYKDNEQAFFSIKAEKTKRDTVSSNLAFQVYKKNSKGIDYIINKIANMSPFKKAMENVLKKEYYRVSLTDTICHFLTNELKETLDLNFVISDGIYPVRLFFKLYKGELQLFIYVESGNSTFSKKEFISNLNKMSGAFKSANKIDVEKNGNRLYSSKKAKVDVYDKDKIEECAKELLVETGNKINQLISVFN